jgi:hypothetical protein
LTGAWELRKLSCKLSLLNSHLMQLLLSCDRGIRVEKTLMQTLASQLSCDSCSRLTGAWELRKLSCKLSLLNSHQLSPILVTVISQRVFLFRLKRKSALDEIMKVREMFISLPVKTFFDLILFLDCCLDRKRKRRKQKRKLYGKKIG